ncbi:MAG: hypothetical protein HY958_03870, partial [Bacteroidia bacterium]|nr:hypothetical protein [Bacteroidia bacterium]
MKFEQKYNRLLELHKRLHELSTDIFWLSYSEEKELLSDDDKNRLEKAGEEEIKLKEDSVVLI